GSVMGVPVLASTIAEIGASVGALLLQVEADAREVLSADERGWSQVYFVQRSGSGVPCVWERRGSTIRFTSSGLRRPLGRAPAAEKGARDNFRTEVPWPSR